MEGIRSLLVTFDVGLFSLTLSRSSKQKKYHCMNLDIQVMSEEDRTEIFQALSSHQAFVHIL